MKERYEISSAFNFEPCKIKIDSKDLKVGLLIKENPLEKIIQISENEIITIEKMPLDGEGILYGKNHYIKEGDFWVHHGGKHISKEEYDKISPEIN